MLNYRDTNYEINTLYQAFSNLTKTIKVARDSLYEGDDIQALLNYHEVSSIFDKLNNNEKLGSCMNNLGCIYLKIDQFENSLKFLNNATIIQDKIIENELSKKDKPGEEVSEKDVKRFLFVNGCRHYNKGLSCKMRLMKIFN